MSSSTTLKVSLTEVKSITEDFAEANVIGDGLLGKSYKGQLSLSGKSIDVAVRRLNHSIWLQDIAFDKEIIMLSSLKHDNLVSLVGVCEENGEMIIINERVAHGSLNRHLKGPKLNWMKRLQISIGVASALSYLHDNTIRGYSVLHHNVNSTSILLDEKWEAKLSGFEYSMTIPIEHLDLAYEKLGIGTYKSDVFSFGIVLFEILCGAEAFTENNKFQAPLAMFHFEGRKLHKMVDPDLFNQMDLQSFNIFSETANYCFKERKANMNQVLTRLKRALKLQEQYENDEHSTVVRKGPSSNNLKLKLKNLEHLRIDLKEIKSATETFASKYCIVSGGFGTVYKAELEHVDKQYFFAIEGENKSEVHKRRSEVAIKRIFNTENDLGEQGFYAEIEMLTSCKHSNILTLLGFCDEGFEMILVYEYASNGSLVDYLKNKSNMESDTWAQRMKICLQVAKGLRYLHTVDGDRQEIVHRDIKSANILLDENLTAKIGDFGLCKFLYVDEDDKARQTREIAGTKVYMDPQYAREGYLKKELDVYSLGIVMFELLCGRLAYDPIYSSHNNQGLALTARQHFNKGTIHELLDHKIKDETTETIFTSIKGPNQDSLDAFLKIAIQCLAKTQSNRPTMEVVIKELDRALHLQDSRKDIFRLSVEHIKSVTEGFSDKYCVERRKLWNVYRTEVSHANRSTIIAVKRLDNSRHETEYALSTERRVLMEHKHENVIGLVGYCDDLNEKIIVHEDAPKGSLDKYLDNPILGWKERLKICIDIASALDFLHGNVGTQEMVIHRDIKSQNVLLDADWKAKIAHFGFSLYGPINQSVVSVINNDAGTLAYLHRSCKKTGLLTKESDIYSFGVVLFEIMCGKLAYSRDFMENNGYLGDFAVRHSKQGKLSDIVYEGIKMQTETQSLALFQRTAIQCLLDKKEERPTAGELVIQLKNALEFQERGFDNLKILFEDARLATLNFSEANCVGRGDFANIYKGEIAHADGLGYSIVIIKRFRDFSEHEQRIHNELKILWEFKHENVIGLVGYSIETHEKLIVYEHASKGSLDRYLNDVSLTWRKRLQICIDIASGLAFLHRGVRGHEVVIHRDIKSANILLGDDWKAKISDFGISFISRLNEEAEYIIDPVRGTQGYIDPQYEKTRFLTTESDIYSFGVILFEILCGGSTYSVYKDKGQFLSRFVNQMFEQGKPDELVFEAIKKQIVPGSLLIFLTVAYMCLHDDREKRPTAKEVLAQLEAALQFQEDYEIWEPKLPRDYKEIFEMSEIPVNYEIDKKIDLYDRLSNGILLQKGKLWFSLGTDGALTEMISAKCFSFGNRRSHKWRSIQKSRFPAVVKMLDISNLNSKIKIKTHFLHPNASYGVHLVFIFCDSRNNFCKRMYVNLKYKKGSESMQAHFATRRDDGWMTIELCQFMNHKEDNDFEILLERFQRCYCGSGAIYVEGIEFRAIDNAKHEQKLKEAQQALKSSSNNAEIFIGYETTDDGEKSFWRSELNGKKCYMVSAKEVLLDSSNVKCFHYKPSEQSRFQEAIELQSQQVFRIKCQVETQMLSPDTVYMCYLVFKLSEKCRGLHCPVKVRNLLLRNNKGTEIIYFRYPTTWNLHDIRYIPKQREDGWMEVNVWQFNSSDEVKNDCVLVNLKFISYEGTMSGLIVEGLEFRPM